MKRYRHYLFLLYLILVISVLSLSGVGAAQNVTSLMPPRWSMGDWWVVECQVYDLKKVVSGPRQPDWSPRQAWRFQVDSTDTIEGEPYFVVSVRPIKDNSCPYRFRYWFRVSDRYVARHELHHPVNTGTKTREIGPPVVTKDFSPAGSSPFFSGKFPTLPITVPLFNLNRESASFSASGGKYETYQEAVEVQGPTVEGKADSALLPRIKTRLADKNRLVTISAGSNISEQQYWNPELPWSVYGERYHKTDISRRYWLVDMGKE